MRQELKDISFKYNGDTVFELFQMLETIQKIHKLNFWDFYDSSSDFDKWCESKSYGKTDPTGKERSHSNIWFKEYEKDIREGTWKNRKYCYFIDMFEDDIEDLGNEESTESYHVSFKRMLEKAKELDNEEFGKDDFRVIITSILIQELGDSVVVVQNVE